MSEIKTKMTTADRYARRPRKTNKPFRMPFWTVPVSFFLVEAFAFSFLGDWADLSLEHSWPLVFGAVWTVLMTALVGMLPGIAGQIAYGVTYFLAAVYGAVQTGYYILFQEMLWLSDFRYASEGSDYFDVLLTYPLGWWAGLLGMMALGAQLVWKFPRSKASWTRSSVCAVIAIAAICGCITLPLAVFERDKEIQYSGSDYGRAQAAEAAYENMFNAHRLYQVCGIYQTGVKDVYANFLYPLTPGYAQAQAEAKAKIDAYFAKRPDHEANEMTGLFEGKNVVFVLMESMDDFAIGEHTPTISRLMEEGINFTNFYTPGYGGVRTFNSEFCTNTGSFLASSGGYAFDYVTNTFDQSLANQLGKRGYSSIVYHYNDPAFYSRGVFSPAMGYERYLSYQDYITEETKRDLYDDEFLFNNEAVSDSFFRDGQKLNFIITRSAHLSYKYNEVLSHYALQKYPEYRYMTGNEETDCMYVKAKLVDDMFARLLKELEAHGELENTVIVAITDHYAYGFKDVETMMDLSGVEHELLLEKTPCFIWSADGPSMEVTKTLNTSDFLPTVLNLLGVEQEYNYLGRDAFDPSYQGYALFSDGSWITQGMAYSAGDRTLMVADPETMGDGVTAEFQAEMNRLTQEFIRINNLMLETDYYGQ